MSAPRFTYENPSDSDNELTVVCVDGGVTVSVSDEKAVGSYNEFFECDVFLPDSATRALRDFLNEQFPT